MFNLITEDERLVYEPGEGAKIFYRRIAGDVQKSFRKQCTIKTGKRRGEINEDKLDQLLVEFAIHGWEGVGVGKKEYPFTYENYQKLPTTVRVELQSLILGSEPETEEEIEEAETEAKNS